MSFFRVYFDKLVEFGILRLKVLENVYILWNMVLDFSKFVRCEFLIFFDVLKKVIVVFYFKVFFLNDLIFIGF